MDENVIMLDAQTSEPDTEFEIGLPDGFGDGDDIFADPSEWKGSTSNEGSQESDTTESDAPTTEQSAEGNEEQGAETEQLPTTQPEVAAPRKLKFQATIDHQSQDVEIDESDLPTLYQKAQNLDRAQERQRQPRQDGEARQGAGVYRHRRLLQRHGRESRSPKKERVDRRRCACGSSGAYGPAGLCGPYVGCWEHTGCAN